MKKNISMGTSGGVIVQGVFWFILTSKNWLCKMNLVNYKAEFVCTVPYADTENYAYKVVASVGNSIFMIPEFGDFLLEYNMENKFFNKFELHEGKLDKPKINWGAVKFNSATIYNNKLWLLPMSAHCIVEFDIKERKLIEHKEIFVLNDNYKENEPLFGTGIFVKEKIWLPCAQENGIIEFNMGTHDAVIHRIGDNETCFSAMTWDEEREMLYLMDAKNQFLYRWNSENGFYNKVPVNIQEYEVDSTGRRQLRMAISCLYVYGEKLLVLPNTSKQFFLFDLKEERIIKKFDKEKNTSFREICELNDTIILMTSYKQGSVFVYDKETDSLDRIDAEFDFKYENYPNTEVYKEEYIYMEEFLRGVINRETINYSIKDNTVGKNIFKYL